MFYDIMNWLLRFKIINPVVHVTIYACVYTWSWCTCAHSISIMTDMHTLYSWYTYIQYIYIIIYIRSVLLVGALCSCEDTWEVCQYRASRPSTAENQMWYTVTCKATRYFCALTVHSTTLTFSYCGRGLVMLRQLTGGPSTVIITPMVFLDSCHKVRVW